MKSLNPVLQLVTPSSQVVLLRRRCVDGSWNTQALSCMNKVVLIRRPAARLGRELRFHTTLYRLARRGLHCSLSTGGECLRFWSCCYVSGTCALVHLDLAGNTFDELVALAGPKLSQTCLSHCVDNTTGLLYDGSAANTLSGVQTVSLLQTTCVLSSAHF